MNIKEAKQELLQTIQVYAAVILMAIISCHLSDNGRFSWSGRPVSAKQRSWNRPQRMWNRIIAYTITHHTRQSATVGLPVIVVPEFFREKNTCNRIHHERDFIASVYEKIEETGCVSESFLLDEINCVSETLVPTGVAVAVHENIWYLSGSIRLDHCCRRNCWSNKSAREFDIVTLTA